MERTPRKSLRIAAKSQIKSHQPSNSLIMEETTPTHSSTIDSDHESLDIPVSTPVALSQSINTPIPTSIPLQPQHIESSAQMHTSIHTDEVFIRLQQLEQAYTKLQGEHEQLKANVITQTSQSHRLTSRPNIHQTQVDLIGTVKDEPILSPIPIRQNQHDISTTHSPIQHGIGTKHSPILIDAFDDPDCPIITLGDNDIRELLDNDFVNIDEAFSMTEGKLNVKTITSILEHIGQLEPSRITYDIPNRPIFSFREWLANFERYYLSQEFTEHQVLNALRLSITGSIYGREVWVNLFGSVSKSAYPEYSYQDVRKRLLRRLIPDDYRRRLNFAWDNVRQQSNESLLTYASYVFRLISDLTRIGRYISESEAISCFAKGYHRPQDIIQLTRFFTSINHIITTVRR